MAITNIEQFQRERNAGIGSADAPVIMGISSFKTPFELWLEKTQQRPPVDLSENEHVHWGIRLEDAIAAEFADRHPELAVRRHRRVIRSRQFPFALAHVDRLTRTKVRTLAPLEIKTSSKWDDWADGVPDYYIPQVQHQLLATQAQYAYVAVLVNGRHYDEYIVARDDDYIAALVEEEAAFMRCVQSLVPPEPRTYGDVMLRYPKAVKDAKVLATADLLETARTFANVNAQRIALEKQEDELKMQIGMALKDAQTLVDAKGTPLVNFTSSERSNFDEKTFAADEPALHEQYMRRIPYRQMRVLKGLKAA